MSARVRDVAAAWVADGRRAVVVEVIATQGSTPRESGARMMVSADEIAGTIGGGHLEFVAINAARKMIASSSDEIREEKFALGPALGQCCGGAVTLRLSPLVDANWPQNKARFSLQLYGAGHVGRAIIRLLCDIDCSVQWIDEREDQFPTSQLPPHIEKVCVDSVEAEVANALPGSFYLVLTHNHDLDQTIVEAILRRGDFGYLGLIGSKTKRARFLKRCEERGIAKEILARITCPIGIAGLDGKEPEIIAVSTVAQLLLQSS